MAQMSPDVVVARWRKHGQDRLYVTLADGAKVGYWDLIADESHPEKPERAELLDSAYTWWILSRVAGGLALDLAGVDALGTE